MSKFKEIMAVSFTIAVIAFVLPVIAVAWAFFCCEVVGVMVDWWFSFR